jgi:hypothetical protein
MNQHKGFLKSISVLTAAFFLTTCLIPVGYAQGTGVFGLPPAGQMVALSPAYAPVMLRGIHFLEDQPLQFDFLIDSGESSSPQDALQEESYVLIKYFLAALAVPDDNLWVNLSPVEANRIIPSDFSLTDMGRDLLAQDYLLKQVSASLLHPGNPAGKAFWSRVFEKVKSVYGSQDVPLEAFHKIWVVPHKAVVYEHDQMVLIAESYLKVMSEADYLAAKRDTVAQSPAFKDDISYKIPDPLGQGELSALQTEILRDIIIPEIEHEVNYGENFAVLRQAYHAMILATWFKQRLRESLLGRIYVDQGRLAGIDIDDPEAKEKIYQQYLEGIRQGVFNFIQEDEDTENGELVPRQYFSGGVAMGREVVKVLDRRQVADSAMLSVMDQVFKGRMFLAKANLYPEGDDKSQPVRSGEKKVKQDETRDQQEQRRYEQIYRQLNKVYVTFMKTDIPDNVKLKRVEREIDRLPLKADPRGVARTVMEFIEKDSSSIIFDQTILSEIFYESDSVFNQMFPFILDGMMRIRDPKKLTGILRVLSVGLKAHLLNQTAWDDVQPVFEALFNEVQENIGQYLVVPADQVTALGLAQKDFDLLFTRGAEEGVVSLKENFLSRMFAVTRSEPLLEQLRDIHKIAEAPPLVLDELMQVAAENTKTLRAPALDFMMTSISRQIVSDDVAAFFVKMAIEYFMQGAEEEIINRFTDWTVAFYDHHFRLDSAEDTAAGFFSLLAKYMSSLEDMEMIADMMMRDIGQILVALKNKNDSLTEVIDLIAKVEKDPGAYIYSTFHQHFDMEKEDAIRQELLEQFLILREETYEHISKLMAMLNIRFSVLTHLAERMIDLNHEETAEDIFDFFYAVYKQMPDNSVIRQKIFALMAPFIRSGQAGAEKVMMNTLGLPLFLSLVSGTLDFGGKDYTRIYTLLRDAEGNQETGFMLLLRQSGNQEFLKSVIHDAQAQPVYRFYAFCEYMNHLVGQGGVFFEQEFTILEKELMPVVDTFIHEIHDGDSFEFLENSLTSNESLRAYLTAMLLSYRSFLPDFHADDAVAVIPQIMQAEFSGYHDNANSLFRIGGRLFKEEGFKTDFLLFVLGHEIAHNIVKTTYNFHGESRWHKMMHEIVADVYAFALLQRMGLSESIKFIMEKFSHYSYLEKVAEDDFFTIEAHEGARAQLALFQLVLESSFDRPFDWNKLGQVVSFMLRRNNIKESDPVEDTFRQMLDYYMNPEKMKAGDDPEWKKRVDIFFTIHPEQVLEGGSGPMRHKILSTVEIGLKLAEYVNSKKERHDDKAMLAQSPPGGVDLASRWLDMDIHRKGDGVSLDDVMTALEADGIAGLLPVIIQFKAVEKGGGRHFFSKS